MAWRTIAVFAALATLAVPAYAEDPFNVSDEKCRTDKSVRCSKVLTVDAVERTPTIGAFLEISGQSIEEMRKRNGWSENVTPDTPFRPGVRIVLWEIL